METTTKRIFFLFGLLTLLVAASCNSKQNISQNQISGDLIIFHAGSLSVPFKAMADSFALKYPGVTIKSESAGSLASIRKITDLNRNCDILASADYSLIDKLMIPEYASWNMKFAGNEMALVYRPQSRKSSEINKDNWYNLLLLPEIAYGRSDPNTDPCGYRTILTLKLAEQYYNHTGLTHKFLGKDERYIRPKEVDLLALLESGTLDYIFIYKSVAIQHHLSFLTLPDSINLKSPSLADFYHTVSTDVAGNKPGETIHQKGEAMVYGLTIPKNSKNLPAAKAFIRFIIQEGKNIMKQMGQTTLDPPVVTHPEMLPDELKELD